MDGMDGINGINGMNGMRGMVLERQGMALVERELSIPEAGPGAVRLRMSACAVCRTDLHVVDGDLPRPRLPLIPGHEIVGVVDAVGRDVQGIAVGDRVGVPWLGWTCGACGYCRTERENLCPDARFHGYTLDGGFAEYVVADARFCFGIPEDVEDAHAAPLLCAGLIGYRSYRAAGPGRRLGLYGFGAAAHIITQVAVHEGREVYAFTRPEDEESQACARRLGAAWAGGADRAPPEPLDAAILFAPVGALVPAALRAVAPGGTVVCAGIHMSEIPAFPYEILWGERVVRSVANLTRRDGEEFFAMLGGVPVRTEVRTYPLARANAALDDLRHGRLQGAAVLVPDLDPDVCREVGR
jgi:propanol-preferring alcohol dehydrogenase